MSDNKAPVRVWINRFDMDGLGHPPRLDHAGEWNCYISAAALRELVERWRAYGTRLPLDGEAGALRMNIMLNAQELEQLLEADR